MRNHPQKTVEDVLDNGIQLDCGWRIDGESKGIQNLFSGIQLPIFPAFQRCEIIVIVEIFENL